MSTLAETLPQTVTEAVARLQPYVLRTPVSRCHWLDGADVLLKCEHLQHTGSFKLRGALNRLLTLDASERDRGIITASTGNHALGVAFAAGVTGLRATIYLPKVISPLKLKALSAVLIDGQVDLEFVEGDGLDAELAAKTAALAGGMKFVSPYNDPLIIAGQGTVGAELAEQCTALDAVFVSVGGGGLISGVAASVRAKFPQARVYGCWARNASAMHDCLLAGEIRQVTDAPTISDGTAGGVEPGSITFELCQGFIDQYVLVSEAEIISAMRVLAENERWIVEGAAGVALAGCLQTLEHHSELAGKTVAVVLCGRNIELDKFLSAIATAH
ncbi:MAG: threonine/serine dehydratase [Gammaproteobacteria bacterium]|nr:threonine/serine dehydratase [Gammaproteobacteria bacterium]